MSSDNVTLDKELKSLFKGSKLANKDFIKISDN